MQHGRAGRARGRRRDRCRRRACARDGIREGGVERGEPVAVLLTGFVGVNMLQVAFTGFCPAAIAFKRLGLPIGEAFK